MASEAVVADHPTSSEQVKDELHEEVKASESKIISPAKESEEVEKPRTEDSSTTPAVPLAEAEDKGEAKPINTPIVQELTKTDEEEKPKAEELVTPVAPLAEAEDKVENKKIEPSVVEEEKKTVEEENMIAEVAPTSKEKPKSEDSSSPAVILVEPEEKIDVAPPVIEVKQAIEEVQLPASEVVPSVESEVEVGDKNIEPPLVEEVKIADEPLVVEEKIATEICVVEEPKVAAEPSVVEGNIMVEPPVVEGKHVQTCGVEQAKDTMEQLVVEEKIATETPLLEEKVTEPSVVEEKIVETPVVGEAKNKTETHIVEEVKNAIESPVVEEEKDNVVPTLAEETTNITGPAVVEELKDTAEPPVLEEMKNADDTPVLVASVEDKSIVAQECTAEPDIADVMEPEAKIVESRLVTETSEVPKAERQKAESVEEKPIEQPKTEGIPESLIEVVDKTKEQAVDFPNKESEPALVNDVGSPEPQSIKEEILETLTAVVEEPQEYVVVETKECVEDSVDKVDDIDFSKEEESTEKASLESKSLVEATLPTKEGQTDAKEEISGDNADLVEELSKKEAVTLVKVEAENKAKDVKTDWGQPKTKEAEELVKSISTTEASENIFEGVITSRNTELAAENGKEDKKSETVTPFETDSNGRVEDKTSEKPDETKPEKPEEEAKVEDTVPTDETKELDDKITSRDLPKEVVSIKSTHKQSNTILSKVKNTLVKAKKAIIGKSTNTKTPSSEPKGETKV